MTRRACKQVQWIQALGQLFQTLIIKQTSPGYLATQSTQLGGTQQSLALVDAGCPCADKGRTNDGTLFPPLRNKVSGSRSIAPRPPRLATGIGQLVCPTAMPISKGVVAYTKPKVADGDAIGPPSWVACDDGVRFSEGSSRVSDSHPFGFNGHAILKSLPTMAHIVYTPGRLVHLTYIYEP